jgi:hypothetical protein
MVRRPYSGDLDFASAQHSACEARVQFLARQLAELLEINFTLQRQRDAAHADLRELKGAA